MASAKSTKIPKAKIREKATNGAPAGEPSPAVEETESVGTASASQRAEVLVDRAAARVASVTNSLARGLFRFGARLREEAEDILAEARELNRPFGS